MLAQWPTPASREERPTTDRGDAEGAPRVPRRRAGAWLASVIVAVLTGGLLGTLFGVWLALR